jgi:2-polyprenyl-3-methyl-5-hydroxy-6-metoxy-1,4-benzoquinol methylase
MRDIKTIYNDLFMQYGRDEKSLGWTKNKQHIRFKQLFRFLGELSKKGGVLLDVGCGFGDLYSYLLQVYPTKEIEYYGIDLMENFIKEAKKSYPQIQSHFQVGNLLEMDDIEKYDYIVASGIFGYDNGGYEQVEKIFEKAYKMCRKGFAMDFLSDKVDYRASEINFFASPEKILSIAYKYSRNVILDNSAMPFEFTITVIKNDKFRKETTVFDVYEEIT